MTSATGGFASAETFPCTVTIGDWGRRFLPSLVVQSLIPMLLLAFLLHVFLNGWLALLVAFVPAAAFGVVQWRVRLRQFRETWGTAALELSPNGVVVAERHCRLELPWDRIQAVGDAELVTMRAGPVSGGGRAGCVAGLLFMATVAMTRRRKQPALIGAGSLTVGSGVPGLVRAQIGQNHGASIVDPKSGRRLTAVVLTAYDRNWRTGRIGGWIRAYRPDLLAGREDSNP